MNTLSWIGIATLAIAIAVGFTSSRLLKPDGAVEQIAEQVIKKETGLDVDFSEDKK